MLNKAEQDSAVWQKLKAFIEEEIERMRALNDTHRSEIDTATLRGEIKFAKRLLSKAEPKPLNTTRFGKGVIDGY